MNAVEIESVQEADHVLNRRLDGVLIGRWIVGDPRPQLVRRDDPEAAAEPFDVGVPQVGVEIARPAVPGDQHHRLTAANVVVAGTDAIDVDELGAQTTDLAVARKSADGCHGHRGTHLARWC